jgi:hypothetical protein
MGEVWFTSAAKGFTQSGNEFIAVGTSDGRIYRITPENDGVNFSKTLAFTTSISIPITGIVADSKSRTLGMINGRGSFILMKPSDNTEEEWALVNDIAKALDV